MPINFIDGTRSEQEIRSKYCLAMMWEMFTTLGIAHHKKCFHLYVAGDCEVAGQQEGENWYQPGKFL